MGTSHAGKQAQKWQRCLILSTAIAAIVVAVLLMTAAISGQGAAGEILPQVAPDRLGWLSPAPFPACAWPRNVTFLPLCFGIGSKNKFNTWSAGASAQLQILLRQETAEGDGSVAASLPGRLWRSGRWALPDAAQLNVDADHLDEQLFHIRVLVYKRFGPMFAYHYLKDTGNRLGPVRPLAGLAWAAAAAAGPVRRAASGTGTAIRSSACAGGLWACADASCCLFLDSCSATRA